MSSRTVAIAAPRANKSCRNVVMNMFKPGMSVAYPGPPNVMTKTRSKIFSEMWPRMITAESVMGRSRGKTT